jgi:hypothetical protein
MRCPFCDGELRAWQEEQTITYGCAQIGCVKDDMPRYRATYYSHPISLISLTFMLDQYYIQIHYPTNRTVISKLVACFLTDTIQLEKALTVDFNDLASFLNKIQTLLTFS